ncbi:MAG: MerR family transcriptional regulator [Firmicutes bacterium]|nr:MerR family transcriptional regulator [Bacillota bacterium]
MTKKGNNCYTSKQVSGILGISKRQLQYWDETGLLKPSRMPACGSGTIRCYTFTDIVQLKIIRRLRDEQISLQKIRKAINYLQGQLEKGNLSFKNPLAELSFVTDGNDIYELKQDKQFAFDLLMNGQIVWYFPIEKTIREVRELEAKFFESILPRTGTQ